MIGYHHMTKLTTNIGERKEEHSRKLEQFKFNIEENFEINNYEKDGQKNLISQWISMDIKLFELFLEKRKLEYE